MTHCVHLADLSLLAEMKRVAGEIAEEPRIDVLINNAGAVFNTRQETRDGLERTFALNHMSYFVITNLLLPSLKPGARIISTASGAHQRAKLNFDDLQNRRGYSGFPVYARSKLCNILFTRELARRIAGSGVTANCLHPGFVATRFGDQSGGLLSAGVRAGQAAGRDLTGRGRQDHHLSGVLAGGCQYQRRIFLRMQGRDAIPGRAQRGRCGEIVGYVGRDCGCGTMTTVHRKNLVREYKERKTRPGIFAIRCLADQATWTGASRDLDSQQNGIWFQLRMGNHMNKALQQSWNEHGADAFRFEILEDRGRRQCRNDRATAEGARGALARAVRRGETVWLAENRQAFFQFDFFFRQQPQRRGV